MRVVPVEEEAAGGGRIGVATGYGGRDGVATGDGGRWRPFGGGRWRPFGDSGRCGDTNNGKLLEGLPSSFDIGISILIFCFLIKFLDLSMGAVAVLTFCCWGAGGGGETGTATRL